MWLNREYMSKNIGPTVGHIGIDPMINVRKDLVERFSAVS